MGRIIFVPFTHLELHHHCCIKLLLLLVLQLGIVKLKLQVARQCHPLSAFRLAGKQLRAQRVQDLFVLFCVSLALCTVFCCGLRPFLLAGLEPRLHLPQRQQTSQRHPVYLLSVGVTCIFSSSVFFFSPWMWSTLCRCSTWSDSVRRSEGRTSRAKSIHPPAFLAACC